MEWERYPDIDKSPTETNWEYCQRRADAIPPEQIVAELIRYLDERHERRRNSRRSTVEAWSTIGSILGHGSGVSSAIAAKYRKLYQAKKA